MNKPHTLDELANTVLGIKEDKKRHFYLYAKNHYARSEDIMDDLQIIYNHVMEHDYGNEYDIMNFLLKLTYPYIKSEFTFIEFMTDIHPANAWKVGCSSPGIFQESKDPYWIRVARKCLSILHFTAVDEIDIDLGKADRNILPIRREAQLKDGLISMGFEYDGDFLFSHKYLYPNGRMSGPMWAYVEVDWEKGTAKGYDDWEEGNEEVWYYKDLDAALYGLEELAKEGVFGDASK